MTRAPRLAALLDAALGYTESSPQWPVFPTTPDKRPAIKTGRDHAEHASTDPDTIRSWITVDYPGCGIGMPTGAPSGTVVIDADRKHDGEMLLGELESALGPLPRERMVRTQSGGLHVYCAHPVGGIRVRTGQGPKSPLGALLCGRAGVDVRADGGIVVLPPSHGYSWIADDDGPLPPLPRLWLLAIQGAGDPPPAPRPVIYQHADHRWCDPERLQPIGDGDRNGALYRRGVALHVAGATDFEIAADLEIVNATKCSPSLPAREVAKIAASAARATGRRS